MASFMSDWLRRNGLSRFFTILCFTSGVTIVADCQARGEVRCGTLSRRFDAPRSTHARTLAAPRVLRSPAIRRRTGRRLRGPRRRAGAPGGPRPRSAHTLNQGQKEELTREDKPS
jgi:hypothetical protein